MHGRPSVVEAAKAEEAQNATMVTGRGVEESVRVVRKRTRGVTPWRWSVDAPRAAYATVMAGVGYLLYVDEPRGAQMATVRTNAGVGCWQL